jgi:hypothetical protein
VDDGTRALRSNAAPVPFEQILPVIERSLGTPHAKPSSISNGNRRGPPPSRKCIARACTTAAQSC